MKTIGVLKALKDETIKKGDKIIIELIVDEIDIESMYPLSAFCFNQYDEISKTNYFKLSWSTKIKIIDINDENGFGDILE
jgi:predicted DNA-binding antitoxin AbrB/MazE fold protein